MLNHPKRLGEMLVSQGLLDPDDLDQALTEQKRTGERLGEILIKMGLITEEDLMRTLSMQLSIPYQPLNDIKIDRKTIEDIPARLVNLYDFVPLGMEKGMLRVAMNDPLDVHVLDELRLHLKLEIDPVFATAKDIHTAIKRFYGIGADTMEGMVEDDDRSRWK